jgi:hypothetical protein
MERYKVETQKLFMGMSNNMAEVLYANRAIIAGGFVSRLFSDRSLEGADIDVYFRNKEDCANALFSLNGTSDIVFDYTDKSVMIKSDLTVIQFVVIGFFETPADIFKNFDFTCVMGAFDTVTEEFVFHEDFLYHNSQRRLVYNPGTEFPIISALRVDKYKKQGYNISKGEFLKVILSLMNLSISTWEQAEKQFGKFYGVSVSQVITDELKKEKFSISVLMDAVSNYEFSDIYQPIDQTKHIPDFERFVFEVLGYKRPVYKFGNTSYLIKSGDDWEVVRDIKYYAEPIDLKIDTSKLYKYVVQKSDGTLVSQWNQKFNYVVGEEASDSNYGLWFYYKEGLKNCQSSYGNAGDRVMIECEPIKLKVEATKPNDTSQYNKVKVLRIVPKEEVEKMILELSYNEPSYSKSAGEYPF